MTDQELLASFKDESSRNYAFNMIMRKYQQKLYWLVRRMVLDHDDTNDLMQNIWVKIWQNLLSFKGESQLYTWLYRIASNEAITFLEKKKKRYFARYEDVENEVFSRADDNNDMDGDAIQEKLERAILALPDKQRLVFNLRYYDEMPYEEMSKVVGTSVGALKASYHHAAKKVESFFTKEN
ncbi:MAG: sigma-70 family RNA polymerase sigma factor [Bacteroidetes bacterium]|nr:sigma-70 family RNA polymerase sigma factor [Bacteroidota bacterium]